MGKKRRVAFNGSPIFAAHEKFHFSCHAGLPCYNQCCRDVSIFLSPYDVVRIKNRLGLDSGEFLRTYTTRLTTKGGLFMVQLNMREDDDLKCHFVTPEGCSIYSDRPWSCRMAPIDIDDQDEYHFIFNDSHCLGLKEVREWTVETWMDDQGMLIYQELESLLREIPSRLRFTGLPTLDRHIAEMCYMACYDVDRFRKFIFESSFLNEYAVPDEVTARMRTDDVELMKYGLAWLLDGVDPGKTIAIRDQVFK